MTTGDKELDTFFARAKELRDAGMEFSEASGIASLEMRIRQWPPNYGDDLVILLYGDFQPPKAGPLQFHDLGITIHPDVQEHTVIKSAVTVLRANVTIPNKSVDGVLDAIRRINILLGLLTITHHTTVGWWNYITHGDIGGGIFPEIDADALGHRIGAVLALSPKVRRKVLAALYWVREPRSTLLEMKRDTLRVYAGYWNAFECLVDAVCLLRPPPKSDMESCQRGLNEYLAARGGLLTLEEMRESYRSFVDPGFVARATHALQLCFKNPEAYIVNCFKTKPNRNRLYDIRNAINHGEIDAENLQELMRVRGRFNDLYLIVHHLFLALIPSKHSA